MSIGTSHADGGRMGLRSFLLPLAVLVLSLAATAGVWYSLRFQAETNAAETFDGDTLRIAESVSARMLAYGDALQALVGLFSTSTAVTREDWRHFIDQPELRGEHPGVDAFGYVQHLEARQLPGYELQMRQQGLPGYHVWPNTRRDDYLVVADVDPAAGATAQLRGYNLLMNAASRVAMEQAAKTGSMTLTGRWAVDGDANASPDPKTLLFAPLYRSGASPSAGAVVGYVFALLDCDDMMTEVLRHSVIDVGLAVYDGSSVAAESLLYANPRARAVAEGAVSPAFSKSVTTRIAGRDWTLHFSSEPYAKAVPEGQWPIIALAAGIPLSLLLFGITWSQATLRSRAVSLAAKMTASLRAQAGLLDLTHDTVLLRDSGNIIRYWNRAAAETYGFSADEAIGRTADDLLKTQFPEPLKEIWQALHNAGRWEGELIHTRRDGAQITVASRWAVHRDAQGRIEAILETNNDVTRQRQAEAERAKLEASLQQAGKLEAIGTLAGGIAHDFNNILGAILGYGELAQSEAAAGGPMQRYLGNIMSAGQRAKSLVARILAFSRSGLGQRVPVHVQSVVAEALDVLQASCPEGVSLRPSLAAGDAAVLGDPNQIHQIALNLGTNAVQAMKQGGTLAVSLDLVTLTEPTTLVAGTVTAGEYVCLAVSDTGGGIEPALRYRIFDPFFTTKGVGVGTGLGLSLVHSIATDLGGGVDMHSEVGEGTTFRVYLPTSGRTVRPLQQREALPQGDGEIIMLVDDEEMLVRLGEEMLAALGYEPAGFTSAAEALAAFRGDPGRFSALLSDETMPEMSGSELAREIRALSAGFPIILMSGYATPALAARAAALSAVCVLNKPLDSRDMARSVRSALGARRAPDRNDA